MEMIKLSFSRLDNEFVYADYRLEAKRVINIIGGISNN